MDSQQCWHLCPCCGCDHMHRVEYDEPIDEWQRFCLRCARKMGVDVVGTELRRTQMSDREKLIAALMNPETSTVVDFEASYKDLYVYGCDRAWAAACADKILAEGGTNRSLQIMNDVGLRNAQRKLNIEHRERIVAQQERSIAADAEQ